MTNTILPRYANILYDESFKLVVGAPGNERLLAMLIELLIPGKRISRLIRLDKENHGLVFSDKNTTFDLMRMRTPRLKRVWSAGMRSGTMSAAS